MARQQERIVQEWDQRLQLLPFCLRVKFDAGHQDKCNDGALCKPLDNVQGPVLELPLLSLKLRTSQPPYCKQGTVRKRDLGFE